MTNDPKNYYKILGINKDATYDEIKKAFRAKSLVCHPDKNKTGDDSEFKLVNEAYGILGSYKRDEYDNPNQYPFENVMGQGQGQGQSHNDIFEQMFRGMGMNININGQNINRASQQRASYNHNIKISLRDAHCGIKKNLKIKIIKNCLSCTRNCSKCNGRGIICQVIQTAFSMQQIQINCTICNGTGIMKNSEISCKNCNGNYEIPEEKIITLDIPICVENGFNIKFDGYGEQIKRNGEIPGDLIINIIVDQDQYFERSNNDLIFKCKLTLVESIVGKIVIVPHFDEPVTINTHIFGIVNPKKLYHLKGKGLGNKGDLIFQFEIEYPDKTFDSYSIQALNNVFKIVGL